MNKIKIDTRFQKRNSFISLNATFGIRSAFLHNSLIPYMQLNKQSFVKENNNGTHNIYLGMVHAKAEMCELQWKEYGGFDPARKIDIGTFVHLLNVYTATG